MKTSIKYRYISLLVIITLLFTGCWDYMEIEMRGYVLGLSIDTAEILKDDSGQARGYSRELEEIITMEGKPKYAYTIQYPIIARAQSRPSGQGSGGGGNKERVWNISIEGNSLFEAQREYSTRTDYPPFYEHMKVIVISEEVARNGIVEPLDMLLRDPEMRRRIQIFITEGVARRVLEVSPKIDDYSSMYINNLSENIEKNSRMFYKMDLGEISEALHVKKSFVVPKLLVNKEEVKDAGGAVFMEGKMLGWVNELDTSYIQWVAGTIKGGTLVFPMPEHPDDYITLEIYKAKTQIRPTISGDEITFNIKTKGNFNIAEQFRDTFYNTFYGEYAKKMEQGAEEKLKTEMERVIKFIQEEYGADIFGFDTSLQRYAPDTWDKVKDNWSEVFKEIKVNISVDVRLKQRGLVK